ncbi:HSF-type DNA-binding-domain-containing protein [Dichotomocladium elegans]|nr:HSF-type DNA-binding-domain-containing protein [Dichotomocladium elegans]
MVEDPEIQHLISWSETGDLFRVYNPTIFSKNVLPQYFKHNNWQSFVRQLNMYGFNKVNDMIHSNLKNENQTWEFRHPHFRKGAIDDLRNIKRKSVRSLRATAPLPSASPVDSDARTDMYFREYSLLEERIKHISGGYNAMAEEFTSLRLVVSKQQEVRSYLSAIRLFYN